MHLQEHFPLRDISALRTGGVTRYYALCDSQEQIINSVRHATIQRLPYRIIGTGSSVLMSDSGYPGLIVHNRASGILFIHERSQVIVESGTLISHVLSQAISFGYAGLEFLAGFGGTIGAAVYRNLSAYGFQMGDYIRSATLLFPSGEIQPVNRDWFEYAPRTSKIKRLHEADNLALPPVILSVTLQLSKRSHTNHMQHVQECLQARRSTIPPNQYHLEVFDSLRLQGVHYAPDSLQYGRQVRGTLYYIDRVSLRACRSGNIGVYPANPNFLINYGMGTSQDAVACMHLLEEAAGIKETNQQVRCVELVGMWEEKEE